MIGNPCDCIDGLADRRLMCSGSNRSTDPCTKMEHGREKARRKSPSQLSLRLSTLHQQILIVHEHQRVGGNQSYSSEMSRRVIDHQFNPCHHHAADALVALVLALE